MNTRRLINIPLILTLLISATSSVKAAYSADTPAGVKVTLVKSDENGVILDYRIDDYQLNQVELDGESYTNLDILNASHRDYPGEPNLPMVSTLIGVPPTATIQLNILTDEQTPIEGAYRLAPGGSPAPLEDDLQAGKFVYRPDDAFYTSSAVYPQQAVNVGEDAWMRDQRMVRLEINPFQYIPVSGELIWHKHLRVEVRFGVDNNLRNAQVMQMSHNMGNGSQASDPFDMVLSKQLINYDTAKYWKGIPTSELPATPQGLNAAQATGPRYKIVVDADGIYKITYDELLNAGMSDIDSIDPTNFSMTNQGRPVAIYVSNNDGNENQFSAGEYILFFGEKFDGTYLASLYPNEDDQWRSFQQQLTTGSYTSWIPHFNATMVEKYTDKNVYWLEVGGTPGLRMNTIDGTPGSADVPTSYRTTVRAEQSHKWKTTTFTSEDTWFWDEVSFSSSQVTRTYTTTLSAIATTSPISATLRGEIVGVTNDDYHSPDHHTKIYLNKNFHPASLIDQTWDGMSRYHFEVNLSQSNLINGTNNLDLNIQKTTYIFIEDMLFDWFEIDYNRQFQANENEIDFSSDQAGTWKYVIGNYSSGDLIPLDVTDPLSPTMVLSSTYNADTLTFEVTHGAGERYFAGAIKTIDPSRLSQFVPVDYGTTPIDYVYITHGDLITGTNSLASYRASQGLLSTLVVNIDDLYNQYNFGIYNPIAIKNFLENMYIQWGSLPTYVVLVGDGHWNFKGYSGYDNPQIYMPPNLAWVDPWQGEVDSANLLATLIGTDPIPDVVIARIPVTSNSQLTSILNKTVLHESTTGQDWQKRFIFVADNTPDDAGDFVAYSNKIIDDYHLLPLYFPDKQYLDDYTDTGTCGTASGRHSCPNATNALIATLNTNGALVVNYVGHASNNIWAAEGIIANEDIAALTNGNHLPILLSWTCLDGYWIHPNLAIGTKSGQGLVEELLRADNKGIVAAFSPNGLGVSTGHDYLQRGFYDEMFKGSDWILGEAALAGKVRLYTTHPAYVDLVQTYTIYGDPALKSPKLERNLLFLPLVIK